jgi:hypothetical protein
MVIKFIHDIVDDPEDKFVVLFELEDFLLFLDSQVSKEFEFLS